MDTLTAVIIAGAASAIIFTFTRMKEHTAECLKLGVEREQTTSQLERFIAVPQPNPDICPGKVLYTVFDEPVTIISIIGNDRSPFQMDLWFCRWYGATDAQGAQVTVKVYNRDPDSEYIFQKEQEAARVPAHPGIVKIVGYGRVDDCPFCVFENMAGGSLRSWLQKRGKLTGSNVLSVVRQVAKALDFAHAHGIIHSDVQPGNVWLDPGPGGRAALAEFGVTQAEMDVSDLESPLPEGFFQYSAPEQYYLPESRADKRKDIYCFGVMCYELIAGVDPWNQYGVIEHIEGNIEKKDAPDIRTHRKDVPESLALRLARTLSRDPYARPHTAAEVLAGIEVEIASLGAP